MFYHNIDPVIFRLFGLEIRYYGLMYVIAFVLAYFIIRYAAKLRKVKVSDDDVQLSLIYAISGMIIGARLFMLFYEPVFYLTRPWELLMIWKGGLSFHGGLLGIIISQYLFCRKKRIDFLSWCDILIIPTGLGLALGRLGNFINGELYGRLTNVPWCTYFRGVEGCRHPSQIYEMLKNLVIFVFFWEIKEIKMKKGMLLALFLLIYPVLRFSVEFVRQPTTMVGVLTMGQFLSVIMFVCGIGLLIWVRRKI